MDTSINEKMFVGDILQLFSETEDIDALFKNVSTSMTNYIRTLSPSDVSSTVRGTAYKTETFVHVHWPWFILPVALSAMACVLFVATIVASMHSGMRVWKNSRLPVLYHGLEPELQARENPSMARIAAQAKGCNVQLRDYDVGRFLLVSPGKG